MFWLEFDSLVGHGFAVGVFDCISMQSTKNFTELFQFCYLLRNWRKLLLDYFLIESTI